MFDDELDAPPRDPGRGAFEWGLASLLVGGFLAVMVPPMLAYVAVMWQGIAAGHMNVNVSTSKIPFALGLVGVMVVGLMSCAFGIRGWRLAARHRRSAAVPVAGLFVSLLAVGGWVYVGILIVNVARSTNLMN